ncbi:MAG: quinone oxidoreductase [Azospirillaceae bacterium]
MAHAIMVHEHGGPAVMRWEEVDIPAPGPGEAHVRNEAVGLNYIDVYHRTGLYPGALPHGIGLEGAGTVVAVGEGVTDFAPGDRVAYADLPVGAYAGERVMPAHRLVKLPDGIDFRTAAAMMLQGMTAQYLLRQTYVVKPGDTVLIHAAAGGVGLIACQWANHLGATVIGTVGTAEKAELARANGCTHPILYRDEDLVKRVREITGGRGCDVVYDSVGRDTYIQSMDCLKKRGLLVIFGSSSGPVNALDTGLLAQKGSLYVTRPTLMGYNAERSDLLSTAADLFEVVLSGAVTITINQEYALKDAAQAHRDLEARKTTGSTILLP